jgi:hypothetical protein
MEGVEQMPDYSPLVDSIVAAIQHAKRQGQDAVAAELTGIWNDVIRGMSDGRKPVA